MTSGLRVSCKHKNKLYAKWLQTKNLDSKKLYLDYKRIFNTIKKKTVTDYYTSLFSNKIKNTKEIWSEINSLISVKKSKTKNSVEKLLVNDRSENDSRKIADAFNEYFCNVGEQLASNINRNNVNSKTFSDYLGKSVSNSFFCENISEGEVLSAINRLKNKKSCGTDDLPTFLYKKSVPLLCQPLAFLFNLSVNQGIFPNCYKIAKVIPLYKKESREIISNYRPISLLNTGSKIFERIIHDRLVKFLEKFNLISEHQFGFRKYFSTTTTLLESFEDCYHALDKKQHALCVFFDLQKAFDTVNYSILLHKRSHYGVRGIMAKWF